MARRVARLTIDEAVYTTRSSSSMRSEAARTNVRRSWRPGSCSRLAPTFNAANAAGDTAVHAAVEFKRKAVFQGLVDRGADVNVNNKRGRTPLSIANTVTRMEDVRIYFFT